MQSFRLSKQLRSHHACWMVVCTLLAVTLLAGCQGNPRNSVWFEASNAEKRFLEEQLYEWQYECQRLEEENEHLKQQVDELRKPNGSGPRNDRNRSGKSSSAPSVPHPEFNFDLEEPEIDMGSPRKQGAAKTTKPTPAERRTVPESLPEPARETESPPEEPEFVPPPERASKQSAADEGLGSANGEALAQVEEIYINPILTQSADFDGLPGDDGLLLVFEPRDDRGRYVPTAGAVSVELNDPRRTGEQTRVGAWQLDPHETGPYLRSPKQGRGIYLPLRFSGPVPRTGKLKLVVRFTTSDDREIEQSHDLVLHRKASPQEQWFARTGQRPALADVPQDEEAQASEGNEQAPRELPSLEPPVQVGTRPTTGAPSRPAWKPVR